MIESIALNLLKILIQVSKTRNVLRNIIFKNQEMVIILLMHSHMTIM